MGNGLADALLDFYQNILKPELDAIKEKQSEHNDRLLEFIAHFDSLLKRLGSLEDSVFDYKIFFSVCSVRKLVSNIFL